MTIGVAWLIRNEITTERASLERAIVLIDGIFSDQTLEPITVEAIWDKWKDWYEQQNRKVRATLEI